MPALGKYDWFDVYLLRLLYFCLVTRLGKIEGKMEKIVYQSNLASISTKSEDALQLTVTVLIQKYPLWKLIKKNVKTYRSDIK